MPQKIIVNSECAPAALGPYSHAVIANGVVYTSGNLGINPETNVLASGAGEQTAVALRNIQVILEKAGSCLENVVKTTIFVKDLNDFNTINDVYGHVFKLNHPARSCVQVARLPKDALVEIECVALTGNIEICNL